MLISKLITGGVRVVVSVDVGFRNGVFVDGCFLSRKKQLTAWATDRTRIPPTAYSTPSQRET